MITVSNYFMYYICQKYNNDLFMENVVLNEINISLYKYTKEVILKNKWQDLPKAKLRDKITTLQQIVSPFGKVLQKRTIQFFFLDFIFLYIFLFSLTFLFLVHEENFNICLKIFQTDTASVLQEAITYINFYQEQVKVKCLHVGKY